MSEFEPLKGKIVLVTGATRGIGKGIALQLGQAGATVYITGRTLSGTGGSLEETAKEIDARGGTCIPVQCDHSNSEEIERLFERIKQEQDGRLDVLVNNAYSAVRVLMDAIENKTKFWEKDPSLWDDVNNVGLRNHYFCTVYAARMMIARQSGLIVNVSSPGGLRYLFNVAYGVGKQALDRMAVDCAVELRKHNVTCVSLWPGAVQTEIVKEVVLKPGNESKNAKSFEKGESTEYAGKAIVYLAKDSKVIKKTGRILLTSELGDEYGFVDINGTCAPSIRSLSTMLQSQGYTKLANRMPSFVKLPYFALALAGSKF